MNIQEQLNDIWGRDYINSLPCFIKNRGYVFSMNNDQKDILITGINPSYRDGETSNSFEYNFQKILKEEKYDTYWTPLKKMIYDPNNSIDLRCQSAYLDIFYFREKQQLKLRKEILKSTGGIQFIVDQLRVTQYTIEQIIKPKLIIVKNRESAVYWGKLSNNGIIWMGYKFDFIQKYSYGELYRISGFIDSIERISPEIKETNLKGSYVLFTHHINQYTKKEKRPNAVLINELLEMTNTIL